MSARLSLAIALTRSWTATYTRGLPTDLRGERREEIDCDLWEHQRLADLQRAPATGTAVEILLRLLLGLPADVIWRLETGASARSGRGTQMNESPLMKSLLAVAAVVALSPVGLGIWAFAGGAGTWNSDLERIAGGFLWCMIGFGMVAGLLMSRTRPLLGIGLLAAGVLAISAMFFWIAVITLPIGAAMVFLAYWRARQAGRPGGLRPA